jgi:methionyl-tRNA formyltransferase
MRMDAGVDTGPLLLSEALPIAPGETTGSLTPRVAQLGAALLLRVLPGWLAGEITPAPQPVEGVTYAPRVEKEDGRIRWDEPADVIERRTRAYHPWPSAYTTWDGRLLKIVRAAASKEQRGGGPAGTVVHGPDGVGVITGNGVLLLEEVQLAGKRPMRLAEFMPGARGFLGAKLGARETVAPA